MDGTAVRDTIDYIMYPELLGEALNQGLSVQEIGDLPVVFITPENTELVVETSHLGDDGVVYVILQGRQTDGG